MTRCRGYGPNERYCPHQATTEGLCPDCHEARKQTGREALAQLRQQLADITTRKR